MLKEKKSNDSMVIRENRRFLHLFPIAFFSSSENEGILIFARVYSDSQSSLCVFKSTEKLQKQKRARLSTRRICEQNRIRSFFSLQIVISKTNNEKYLL